MYVCVSRSVGDGSPHDVHHSLPADSQSGPRGLETSDVGLQLVIHVSDVGSFYFAPKQPDILVIFKLVLNNNSPEEHLLENSGSLSKFLFGHII